MSFQNEQLLEFGDFRLDLVEKGLFHNGSTVPLTPKVFETLQVLVENAGHLVGKDELMHRVWPDRFVEESNVSFNIKMLRKALNDNASAPIFIETVPRRGYRFIAKVTTPLLEQPVQPPAATPGRSRLAKALIPGLVVLFAAAAGAWLWFGRVGASEFGPPILAAPFSSDNLSTSGKVLQAAISPDGKLIAYSSGLGADKQSLWLRELSSSNNRQIIPPSDDFYYDLVFSPDGGSLYFVRGPKPGDPMVQGAIYRVSIFGGIAAKVIDQAQGGISLSPDGGKLSFIRCAFRDDEWCSLWIADSADGRNERRLASRPKPIRISDNAISPDGKSIAYSSGQSRDGANEFSLSQVDLATGAERSLGAEHFFDIRKLLWLPGRNGLLLTALRFPDKNFRIWRISEDGAAADPLTKDSNDYAGISMDREGRVLVATNVRPAFYVNLYPQPNAAASRQILTDAAATVSFTPDGKLAVSTGNRGNHDIWTMDAKGGLEKQLTTEPLDDLRPVFSAAHNKIFFASNRTGKYQVWQMGSDGGDQKQVTFDEGGFPLAVTPDGKEVFYHSALGRTLRKVSLDNGAEQDVISEPSHIFAVSPDCKTAAMADDQAGEGRWKLMSLQDGKPVREFTGDDPQAKLMSLAWSVDGRSLYYVSAANNYEKNSLWKLSLDKPLPRKIFDLPNEGLRNENSLAVSPDERTFAVIQGNWQLDAVMIRGFK